MEVPANYLLLIENLLDITHFYPLHDGNIGDIANSRIPVELEEGETDGNKFCGTRPQGAELRSSRRTSSTGSTTRPSIAFTRTSC